jgi:hypothetical protein
MALLVGLIVNAVLLSIPIGATLGALFGIRPFENERPPEEKDLNALVIQSFCDEFHEFAQNKIGQNFTCELWDMIPLSIWLGMSGIMPCIYIMTPLFCLY